jgi:hypothetical protein
MYQLGNCLFFYKIFNSPARILFVIIVGVINLKSVLNYGDPLVEMLLSSATNIRQKLLN